MKTKINDGWYACAFSSLVHSCAVLFGLIHCSTLNSQETESPLLRYVCAESDSVCVLRPAELLNSDQFKQLDREADEMASKLVDLLTDSIFKMSLTNLDDINEIIFALKTQTGPNGEEAFVIAIIRAKYDSLQRFETATHEGTVAEEFDGKEILGIPRGGFKRFRFAYIIDNKTIVWAWSPQGIKAVIRTKADDHTNAQWYEVWKRYADSPFSFGATSRILVAFPVLKDLQGNRTFGAGLNIGSPCSIKANVTCKDENDAGQFIQAGNELLVQGREALQNLTLQNKKSELEKPLLFGQRFIDSVTIRQNGNEVALSANFVLNAKTFAPMIKSYVAQFERANDIKRIRSLARALLSYEQAYGHFPKPIMEMEQYGKKYSWRVALLPMLGEATLQEAYRFDQDWNSPHNRRVTAQMPDVFRSSLADPDSTESSWYLVYGKEAVFDLQEMRTLSDITDGPGNTIMAVEAKTGHHWAEPVDLQLDGDIVHKLGGFNKHGFNALFADGNSYFLSDDINRELIMGLLTARGGEKIDASVLAKQNTIVRQEPDGELSPSRE